MFKFQGSLPRKMLKILSGGPHMDSTSSSTSGGPHMDSTSSSTSGGPHMDSTSSSTSGGPGTLPVWTSYGLYQ